MNRLLKETSEVVEITAVKKTRAMVKTMALFFNFIGDMDKEQFFSEIRDGNFESVERMITEQPQLIHTLDQRGSTPLILATYYEQSAIVTLLLDKGANVNGKDASGNTALMGVCFKGFTALAEKLIAKGANVNESNAMGGTSLIYAATFNRLDIAKLLLAQGADTRAKDGRGNTALDHAKMQETPELEALLQGH